MSMTCDLYAVSAEDARRLRCDPRFFRALTAHDNRDAARRSLEKAWHGLHYLLTAQAWTGDLPLGFIVAGGEEVAGSDCGYGPARLFTPDQARQIHEAIAGLTDDQVWSGFDPVAMSEEGIYPQIWDEPEIDLRDEYLFYFHEAQRLLADAVAKGSGLLVMLA